MLLIPMIATALLARFFTAVGLRSLLSHLSYSVKILSLMNAINYSRLMTIIMPGRSGDFSIIIFLKKHTVPLGVSLATTILDKITSLILFSALAFIGTFFFAPQFQLAILFYAIIFSITIFLYIKFHGPIHTKIKRILLGKYIDHFNGFWSSCVSLLRAPYPLTINFVCTLVKWGVTYSLTWLLFQSFGAHVTLFQVCCISGIISIIQLLPISISGLGVSQVSAIYLYDHLLGIPEEITASVVLLWLVVQYLFDILFCAPSFFFPSKNAGLE